MWHSSIWELVWGLSFWVIHVCQYLFWVKKTIEANCILSTRITCSYFIELVLVSSYLYYLEKKNPTLIWLKLVPMMGCPCSLGTGLALYGQQGGPKSTTPSTGLYQSGLHLGPLHRRASSIIGKHLWNKNSLCRRGKNWLSITILTHCGPVILYCDINLGQHWLR